MYTHQKDIMTSGVPLKEAKKALILLHGRGGRASDILLLASELHTRDFAVLVPQATNQSWYPYSFMAPVAHNQPALDSGLALIGQAVDEITDAGIASTQVYFAGFSQGACIMLEYTARNAQRYGGIVAFTGGLIGEKLATENYRGSFLYTPVLMATGDPDPHVPLARVQESAEIFNQMGAEVKINADRGRPHTITPREIDLANQYIFY